MSTDHGVTGSLPSGPKENPEFLRVKQADFVVIAKVAEEVAQSKLDNGDRKKLRPQTKTYQIRPTLLFLKG